MAVERVLNVTAPTRHMCLSLAAAASSARRLPHFKLNGGYKMRSKSRLPGSGRAFSMLLIGSAALLLGAPAHADPASQPAAGILRVPNVRVEMATPRQLEQAAGADPVRSASKPA